MAWVNYRETVERFGHIDAEFIGSSSSLNADGGEAEVKVRFYPWWEHPLYVAARDLGDSWGFSGFEPALREVCIRAVRPRVVRLSPRAHVPDWRFELEHPLLWQFAERVTFYVNGPYGLAPLLAGLEALKMPNVSRGDLREVIGINSGHAVPHGMTLPAQLFEPVLSVFKGLNVPVFAPRVPNPPPPVVVFFLGEDYIIADDFEVDVPIWEHKPEWFGVPPEDAG